MLYNLVHTLAALAPSLPTSLIPEPDAGKILGLARQLPDAAHAWGFECRLGAGSHRVDFGICTPLTDDGPSLLAQHTEPVADTSSEAWKCIRKFCRVWRDPSSLLHHAVRTVFLEFDMDDVGAAVAQPSFFAALCIPELRSGTGDEQAIGSLVLAALDQMRRTGSTLRMVERCLSALPNGAFITFVAVMFPRPLQPIRLHVWLPPTEADRYMRTIGIPPPSPKIADLIDKLNFGTPYVELAFDVLDQVFPRVGLEYTFNGSPNRSRRFPILMEHFVRHHLCTEAKRDALRSWTNRRDVILPNHRWPCTLHTNISHLKMTFFPERIHEVKAYLAVTPMFQLFS